MITDYDDGIAEDYRNEQAYFDREGAIPRDKDGLTARFAKIYDSPDCTTCDCLIVDRTTGKIITRYDAADPANTRFDYGAKNDGDVLRTMGYDIKEMVDPSAIITTPERLSSMVQSQCLGCSSCEGRSSYDEWDEYDRHQDARLYQQELKEEEERHKNRFKRRNELRRSIDYSDVGYWDNKTHNLSCNLTYASNKPIAAGAYGYQNTHCQRRLLNDFERRLRNAWKRYIQLKNQS